jgi:hypothetical protein
MVCQFKNGMVYPPATSEAGARRPAIIQLEQFKADIGHILFLRILYHIPYHGQKSDIISYPISRLKKG